MLPDKRRYSVQPVTHPTVYGATVDLDAQYMFIDHSKGVTTLPVVDNLEVQAMLSSYGVYPNDLVEVPSRKFELLSAGNVARELHIWLGDAVILLRDGSIPAYTLVDDKPVAHTPRTVPGTMLYAYRQDVEEYQQHQQGYI